MNGNIVKYKHHHRTVSVYEELKGKHRAHCLCYDCRYFKPGEADNCIIAQKLYTFDIEHGVTTPVWECEVFKEV